MWILLETDHILNSNNRYFVSAFNEKPTIEQLKTILPDSSEVTLERILSTSDNPQAYHWYQLVEVQEGTRFNIRK